MSHDGKMLQALRGKLMGDVEKSSKLIPEGKIMDGLCAVSDTSESSVRHDRSSQSKASTGSSRWLFTPCSIAVSCDTLR